MKSRIQIAFISLLSLILLAGITAFFLFARSEAQIHELNRLEQTASILADAGDGEGVAAWGPSLEAQTLSYLHFDAAGALISSSDGLAPELVSGPGLRDLLQRGEGSATLVAGDASYFTAVSPLPGGGSLVLTEPIETVSYIMDDLRNQILLGGFLLFVLGGLGTWYFSGRLMKPIEELTEATGRITDGELSHRIQLNDLEDLAPVASHFNHLADRLETTILDSLSNQNQLHAILTSMNSGVIAVDGKEKILIFNAFARKIFGIFTEPIGKDIRDVIKSEDVEQILEESEEFQELRLRRSGKTVVRFKTTELITDRNFHRGKVTVIQDVTDLKRLEQMRSQFVANVSHELKTPLTSIKGFAETLRDVEDPVIRNKFLDIIDAEAERLRRLIEDILSLSSIESLESSPKELIKAAESTIDGLHLLEVQARSKNIDLSLIIKGEPEFIGDEEMYRQLIINLVDNAIKYTDNNGRVKVRLEEEAEQVILSVQDNGVGIPADHLPRLFERFYRVDNSRDRAKGGTGLGLAIVKHITLAFGGTITVDSREGEGTTFTVSLPAHRNRNQPPGTRIQTIKFNG